MATRTISPTKRQPAKPLIATCARTGGPVTWMRLDDRAAWHKRVPRRPGLRPATAGFGQG